MSKAWKIALGLAACFALLLVVARITLPQLFDANEYRWQLEELVERETGRKLTLGHLELQVFPWLRVEVKDVRLGNAPGFGDAPMLTAQRLKIGLRLWPLLSQRLIKAENIELEGVNLALAIDAGGRSNWDDLLEWQRRRPASEPLALDIAGLTLTNAQVLFEDARSGQRLALSGFQLRTGRLHGAEPFTLQAATQMTTAIPNAEARIALDTVLALNLAEGPISFSDFKLAIAGSTAATATQLPLSADFTAETAQLSFDATKQTLLGAPLKLSIKEIRQGLAQSPKLLAKGEIIATPGFDLTKQHFALASFTGALKLSGAVLPGGLPQMVQAAANLEADLAAGTASIKALRLTATGIDAAAELALQGLQSKAWQLSGPLSLAPFNPRTVMAALALKLPATSSNTALTNAQLSAQLRASAGALNLTDLVAQIDSTRLSGSFAIPGFNPAQYRFQLLADSLNADSYLPPAAASPPKPKAPVELLQFEALEAPLAALKALDAEGSLRVGLLQISGYTIKDAQLQFKPNQQGAR